MMTSVQITQEVRQRVKLWPQTESLRADIYRCDWLNVKGLNMQGIILFSGFNGNGRIHNKKNDWINKKKKILFSFMLKISNWFFSSSYWVCVGSLTLL